MTILPNGNSSWDAAPNGATKKAAKTSITNPVVDSAEYALGVRTFVQFVHSFASVHALRGR